MKKFPIFIVLFFLTISSAYAQATSSEKSSDTLTKVKISPSIHEAVIKQGSNTKQTFEITNKSSLPLPIKSYIRSFTASDEINGVSIDEDPDANRLDITNWINITEPDFILQSNSSRLVTVNFSPPRDLPPGGYYGVLFFEPVLPESILSSNSLNIGGRIGALLFLVASGDIKEKAQIASINGSKHFWHRETPQIALRLQNTGNVHIRFNGTATIINRITNKSQKVNLKETTILPQKIRQMAVPLNSAYLPGFYRVDIRLNYGKDKIPINSQFSFTYFPLLYIIALFIAVIIIRFIIMPRGRQRLKRAFAIIFHNR